MSRERKFSYWLLGLTALLVAPHVSANLRAPRVIPQAASSALYEAQGLTVLGETLELACSLQSCRVRANYRVQSDSARELAFTFVLPDGVPVDARVQGVPAVVTVAPRVATQTMERWTVAMDWWYRESDQFHEASFSGHVGTGVNQIEVLYDQPLAAIEGDYGYWKKGRFVFVMRYDLWPLKQWKLAPDFTLEVRARFAPEVPAEWWQRIFSKRQEMRCKSVIKKQQADPTSQELEAKPYVLEETGELQAATYGASDLPDRLLCRMGDADLVRY